MSSFYVFVSVVLFLCLFRLVVLCPTCVLVAVGEGRPVLPLRLLVGVVEGCKSPFLQSLQLVWSECGVAVLVVVGEVPVSVLGSSAVVLVLFGSVLVGVFVADKWHVACFVVGAEGSTSVVGLPLVVVFFGV